MENNYRRQELMGIILKALQALGGSGTRDAIRETIIADNSNDIIYEHIYEPIVSKKGNKYIPFRFDFNMSFINLNFCGYIERFSRGSDIVLTEKGRKAQVDLIPTNEDKQKIDEYWKQKHQDLKDRKKQAVVTSDNEEELPEEIIEEDFSESWKIGILERIKQFSPKKFESFSRLLFSKMGVKFDEEKGVQMSGDHGIDGYGYFESDEFRTSKIVVQCKRYTDSAVSEPEIDKFKGVMMSFSADYGIFITTSYFTKQAREKAVKGGNTVTLVDGQRLVELIEKYKLHITPVQTYSLNDYYYQKD